MLKWLREVGCPWDGATFSSAEKTKHEHVMKWLIKNGALQEAKVLLDTDSEKMKKAELAPGYSIEVKIK